LTNRTEKYQNSFAKIVAKPLPLCAKVSLKFDVKEFLLALLT